MTSREELLERLEKALEPSDELDARILCLLAAPKDSYVEQSRFNGKWCIFEPKTASGRERLWEYRGGWFRPGGWPVTASVDAAIGLVERVLPVMADRIFIQTCKPAKAGFVDDGRFVYFEAATPAIALLIALLRSTSTERGEG